MLSCRELVFSNASKVFTALPPVHSIKRTEFGRDRNASYLHESRYILMVSKVALYESLMDGAQHDSLNRHV